MIVFSATTTQKTSSGIQSEICLVLLQQTSRYLFSTRNFHFLAFKLSEGVALAPRTMDARRANSIHILRTRIFVRQLCQYNATSDVGWRDKDADFTLSNSLTRIREPIYCPDTFENLESPVGLDGDGYISQFKRISSIHFNSYVFTLGRKCNTNQND